MPENDVRIHESNNNPSTSNPSTSNPSVEVPFAMKHPVAASAGRIAATGAIGAVTIVASAFLWHLGTTLAQRVLPTRYVISLRGAAPAAAEAPSPVSAS